MTAPLEPIERIRQALAAGPTEGPWGFHARLSGSENHKGFLLLGPRCAGDRLAEIYPLDEDGSGGGANAEFIAACSPDALRSLLSRLDELEKDAARLIEDRARFPDRPDDIGSMISARYNNLKAAAEANENAWRMAQTKLDACAPDGERLEWLMRNVSGKELRRIGVKTSGNCDRAAIDSAIAKGA